MEHYIFELSCADKIKDLCRLETLVSDFRSSMGRYHVPKGTEEIVLEKLETLLKDRESEVKSIQDRLRDFFIPKFNKYWKMKIITQSKWGQIYIKEYLVFPYKYIEENQYLACVCSGNIAINNGYTSEFKDSGFMLDEFFNENTTVEMEEISKEIFVETAKNTVDKVLEYRLNRLKMCND